ncbi:MAG: hypothetical protein JST79_10670 [Acidobacteria bacterium]|jgi:YbbR domain-containing protein|nr:hypothetical protein [Acidobacteriota bacterium]
MRKLLQRLVVHNFTLKLIALVLAVGLWLAVARDPIAEVAVDVPIEFRNMPADLEISSEQVPQAQVRVRGPERLIHQMRLSDLHLEIDLSTIKPGQRTFDLTSHEVQHPPSGLEVVQVVPSQLHMAFDARLTRQVEVRPRVVGSFASGYHLGRILVDPPFVTISGPRKRVETVDAAITDPIDASGVLDQANFVRHAYVSDPLVQVLNSDPVRIAVIMEKSGSGR